MKVRLSSRHLQLKQCKADKGTDASQNATSGTCAEQMKSCDY